MTIDPKERIAGVPLIRVRDFLRKWKDSSWNSAALHTYLRIDPAESRGLIEALIREGYVERSSEQDSFSATPTGLTLAAASAAPRISRRTAERKLKEFLGRVAYVNNDSPFAWLVSKVTVIGSYLTNSATLSDIDLVVELRRRHDDDRKLQKQLERDRINASGRRSFGNIIEEMGWPETEVNMFLKARSRVFQFVGLDSPFLKSCEKKVIFEEGGATEIERSESKLQTRHYLNILLDGQERMIFWLTEQESQELHGRLEDLTREEKDSFHLFYTADGRYVAMFIPSIQMANFYSETGVFGQAEDAAPDPDVDADADRIGEVSIWIKGRAEPSLFNITDPMEASGLFVELDNWDGAEESALTHVRFSEDSDDDAVLIKVPKIVLVTAWAAFVDEGYKMKASEMEPGAKP